MNGIEGLGNPTAMKIGKEVSPPRPQPGQSTAATEGAANFKNALAEASDAHDLKFSKHAVDRMELRNAEIGRSELDRLGKAVSRAEEKGANESLVLLDKLAFVVSVQNRTVITAMQQGQEGVFTSIDSAVIA